MRRARAIWDSLAPTLRYWMQTEVHVFAFSTAANVLLSFFPFLIVMMSVSSMVFDRQTAIASIDTAMRDFFPDSLGTFLHNNLPVRAHVETVSLILLLFTANGVFEPLEVALNHVWGVRKNRSFFNNQVVSLILIFACGGLGLCSLLLTGMNHTTAQSMLGFGEWIPTLFFKLAAVPVTVIVLFLIYYFVPNFRPPRNRVIAAAIVIGVLLEALKYLNKLVWPWFFRKLTNEYGVFKYSVTLIFIGFVGTMLVLAGAEWAARGNRADREPAKEEIASA
jgi:YihY family inner membrane protein